MGLVISNKIKIPEILDTLFGIQEETFLFWHSFPYYSYVTSLIIISRYLHFLDTLFEYKKKLFYFGIVFHVIHMLLVFSANKIEFLNPPKIKFFCK